MVAPGKGTMHVHLMPRMDITPWKPTGGANLVSVPYQCFVGDDRRLHCTIRWFDPGVAAAPTDLPGMCDYLVVVAVAAA